MWCKCWSLHDLWYFLAGAAFWDMLVHIGFQAYGLLPIWIGVSQLLLARTML